MMRFPLTDLLDQQESYQYVLSTLHPDGLPGPAGHPLPADQATHDQHRAPIQDYRCRMCGRVFNLFTGTAWLDRRLLRIVADRQADPNEI